jgi:hypothetical protein
VILQRKLGMKKSWWGIRILKNGTIKFVALDLLRTVPIREVAVVKGNREPFLDE